MYQIDKWEDLGAGCRLIVLSPTNNFNVQKDGPDAIYYRMLDEASVGELALHRVKDILPPIIDNHFHKTMAQSMQCGLPKRTAGNVSGVHTNGKRIHRPSWTLGAEQQV